MMACTIEDLRILEQAIRQWLVDSEGNKLTDAPEADTSREYYECSICWASFDEYEDAKAHLDEAGER